MPHYGCTMYNQTLKSVLPASLFLVALLLGEDEAGNIYVADHGAGKIYLITAP
jgi:hypothetical protein